MHYLSKDWLALSRIVDLLFWLVLENWPSNDQDLLKTFDFFTKWNNFQFYEGPQEWLVLKNYFIQLRRLVIVDILEQLSNGGRQETVPYEIVIVMLTPALIIFVSWLLFSGGPFILGTWNRKTLERFLILKMARRVMVLLCYFGNAWMACQKSAPNLLRHPGFADVNFQKTRLPFSRLLRYYLYLTSS